MGQYKFQGQFRLQIGLKVEYEHKNVVIIDLPFMRFTIGLTKEASGVDVFGIFFK